MINFSLLMNTTNELKSFRRFFLSTIKSYKLPIFIALIQWYVTILFQVEKFFTSSPSQPSTRLVIHILYLFCLIFFWSFIFFVKREYKNNTPRVKRCLEIFIFYFSCMLMLLLFLWPGTWSWDDIFILDGLTTYQVNAWHHILGSYIQLLFIQLLPFPGGIILIQLFIISLCVSFIVNRIECNLLDNFRLNNYYLDLVIKTSVFFLPPILLYQFSGFRMGLYIYLELVVLVTMICSVHEQKLDINKKLGPSFLILFIFLLVIVSLWRSESFLYLPIGIYFIFTRKHISIVRKILLFSLILLFSCSIIFIQNKKLGNDNYKLISTLCPIVEIIRLADDKDKILLDDLAGVLNLDTIYGNRDNGTALYWKGKTVKRNYSKEDFHKYMLAFFQLCIRHSDIVFKERWDMFIRSLSLYGKTHHTIHASTRKLFSPDNKSRASKIFREAKWPLISPIYENTRVIILDMLSLEYNGKPIPFLYQLFWSPLLPIIVLLFSTMLFFLKKEWFLFFIFLAVALRIPIVILTEPAPVMMYYLSFYMCGYLLLLYLLLLFLKKWTS